MGTWSIWVGSMTMMRDFWTEGVCTVVNLVMRVSLFFYLTWIVLNEPRMIGISTKSSFLPAMSVRSRALYFVTFATALSMSTLSYCWCNHCTWLGIGPAWLPLSCPLLPL